MNVRRAQAWLEHRKRSACGLLEKIASRSRRPCSKSSGDCSGRIQRKNAWNRRQVRGVGWHSAVLLNDELVIANILPGVIEESVVKDAVAAPKHRPPAAGWAVGEAKTRSPIVLIRIVEALVS